jgi:hypothetical protein
VHDGLASRAWQVGFEGGGHADANEFGCHGAGRPVVGVACRPGAVHVRGGVVDGRGGGRRPGGLYAVGEGG